MNTFFLDYRDPLFSIIVLFVLIFLVTFISYWWGRYKHQEDDKDLDRFLQNFRSLPSQKELQLLISSGEIAQKSWLLLASSYSKNGDFEKSIEIYTELLKVGEVSKKEIMFLLGKTYFKAGFLERSKEIFLEILKHNPRTPQALRYLLLVYEYLRNYKAALEVLEPLDILEEDIYNDAYYLRMLNVINNPKLQIDEKQKKLLALHKESGLLSYMVFEFLFRTDVKLAWNAFKEEDGTKIVDILWRLDKKDLDLDIISQSNYLKELYSARGDIAEVESSEVFEFNLLIHLKNETDTTLNFEYICDNCKHTSPFASHRCSNCHAIDKQIVEFTLTKDYYRNFSEENNSFQ
jgi:tetratricopeptide (TPR) repeat protein